MARSWDLLRGDTSGWADRAFYLNRIAESGEPVLDVGCGTGRLLLDYMARGIDIDGVDNSAEMLALCREKAGRLGLSVRVHEQSLETMDLPRRYRTILIPSSTLQLITDLPAVERALRAVLGHLVPGGWTFASIMTLWKPGDPLESEWDHSVVRPEDGATVRRLVRVRHDPENECEHTDDLYQVIVDDQGGRGSALPSVACDTILHAGSGAEPFRGGGVRERQAVQ